jgi:hypothetical protein
VGWPSAPASQPAQQPLRLRPATRVCGGAAQLLHGTTSLRTPAELLDPVQHAWHDCLLRSVDDKAGTASLRRKRLPPSRCGIPVISLTGVWARVTPGCAAGGRRPARWPGLSPGQEAALLTRRGRAPARRGGSGREPSFSRPGVFTSKAAGGCGSVEPNPASGARSATQDVLDGVRGQQLQLSALRPDRRASSSMPLPLCLFRYQGSKLDFLEDA